MAENLVDRGNRSDPTNEAHALGSAAGTYDLNDLAPRASVIEAEIPASGNQVINLPSVGKKISGIVLVKVVADGGGGGNVQDSNSGVDGGFSGFPALANLTAVGDYWLLEYFAGQIVVLHQENAT